MSVELESVKLKKLFDKKKGGLTQAKFGEMFAIGSQGVVCHYLNGRLLLNVEVAKKFAKGLNITVRDFSPRLADEIENGVGEETFRVPVTIMIRPELRGKMLKVLACLLYTSDAADE